jgi:hypothetical protein
MFSILYMITHEHKVTAAAASHQRWHTLFLSDYLSLSAAAAVTMFNPGTHYCILYNYNVRCIKYKCMYLYVFVLTLYTLVHFV